jgi:hypothetical protein
MEGLWTEYFKGLKTDRYGYSFGKIIPETADTYSILYVTK